MANILSQDEVDSLLKGLTDGEIETETDTPAGPDEARLYDFTGQEQVVDARMPTLDMINGRFCVRFRMSLASLIRKMVDVSVDSVGMVRFEKFHRSLPVPTSLHIFRMEPLKGHAILVLESRLAYNLIECYFGGKASEAVKVEGREYTSIENKMLQNVVKVCLEDLAHAWRPVHEITMTYARSEANPQFAGVALPNDLVTVISYNVELDGVSCLMKVCIPYSTTEPIREKLRVGFQGDQLEEDMGWKRRLMDRVRDMNVEMSVELGSTPITGQRLLTLKGGDVVQLQQDVHELLAVKIEGVAKFKGRAGVRRNNKAIRIEHRCSVGT